MMKEKLTEKDACKIVIELAKQGTTCEKIGLVLKKEHGIKDFRKEYGKKISQILRENNLYISPDKKNLSNQTEKLIKHLSKHKQDHSTKRILLIKEARLRKLEKMGY